MKKKLDVWQEYSKQEVVNTIREYVKDQIALSQRKCLDDEAFSRSSWPYNQAKELGLQKAFEKILNFIPEKIND